MIDLGTYHIPIDLHFGWVIGLVIAAFLGIISLFIRGIL